MKRIKITKKIWVVPDKKDEVFSLVLIERICASAPSFDVFNFSLEISEQYDIEDSPHYHTKVDISIETMDEIGERIEIEEAMLLEETQPEMTYYSEITSNYSATLDCDTFFGEVKIVVSTNEILESFILQVLGSMAFGLYDEAVRVHYPEYETIYYGFHIFQSHHYYYETEDEI